VADQPPADDTAWIGITITRVFEAPRELVWKEWTEPERFADWYGGTTCEIPISTVSMDVRPGGTWKATMFCEPGRREINWEGAYREVVEPERLAFTVTDQPGDEDHNRDVVIVVLTDLGDDRTEMLFEQRDHMTPEQYEAAEQGWQGFFDRIEERLAAA
jgi:uncharacterized protein YndB with AHSA1/START domain